MANDKDPPLYLHITAVRPLSARCASDSSLTPAHAQESAEKLAAGMKAVQELIDQELGPLIDPNRFRDRDQPRERVRPTPIRAACIADPRLAADSEEVA